MPDRTETIEGYVVDLACVRKYPRAELLDRAREHTKRCATMGHCVESGYGLVDGEGQLTLLDTGATPMVVEALGHSARDHGIRLRARRELRDQEMHTTFLEEV